MRLLDLFCGGGLAGAGYWQSGCFSEIVGVDEDPAMKRVYPFDFVCSDAWKLDYDFLLGFDFIHASPPCQWYSAMTPPWARDRHVRSIPPTHLMLKASGLPYVIENVPGSGHDLRPNLILSGRDVGLPIDRPRLFHINSGPGAHVVKMRRSAGANVSTRHLANLSIEDISQINPQENSQMIVDEISQISDVPGVNVHGDEYVSRDELIDAFDLRNLAASHLRRLTITHIEQGIPPAMTRWIALELFPKLMIA